ncbi:unnamed protein product [Closterium sp. NIES-65]|nr:unnamed protein product [Closterium sp. NIES-65]CAI5951740.1 unnamed protein product [Closterium sp. NIES-65]
MAPLMLTCGTAADFSAAIPHPLVSPLIGAAADYSAIFPRPLVSPLISAAADYSAIFPPPLVSPLIGSAANYFAIFPPPLVSPRIGSAADYSATFPPPLVSPFSGSTADYPALIPPPLMPLPTSALQLAVNFPGWPNCLARTLSNSLVSGFNLWFATQQSGFGAIHTSPSAPTSSSSDPYADGLRHPCLHPSNSSPSVLTHPLCQEPSRLSYDLLSVIALLPELTSLRLADFTTMADYIARVQTLSSQLAAQQFELSYHVCDALLLTNLTPDYSVHVTLYGERRADQWSFSRVSAFLLQAELNLRSCPPTVAAVTPSSTPPPLPTTTATTASYRPHNTFPPCTYIICQGPRRGQPCGRTNHPTSSCF